MYNLKALVHNKKNYLLFINILIELLELFEGVLLKVIFIDILITGFGGAITDLLQVLEVCAES